MWSHRRHCDKRCGCCVQVAVLFRNHKDLLQEFSYFLPDSSQPQVGSCLEQWRVGAVWLQFECKA